MAPPSVLLLLCLVAVSVTAKGVPWVDLQEARQVNFSNPTDQWQLFKTEYGKQYSDQAEEAYRKYIFLTNLKKISAHNLLYDGGLTTYRMGVNQFTDMDENEFTSMMTGLRVSTNQTSDNLYLPPAIPVDVPISIDWRQKRCVTPVKNQGQCGSCWAFSVTGALEGQHARKTDNLVSLSEQNLLDCSWPFGTKGCDGGIMRDAYNYIIDNNGISTEECYPYETQVAQCRFQRDCVGATMKSFSMVESGNEEALKQAVALNGPVSVGFVANSNMRDYKKGLYDDPTCGSNLNHAALVVGYGTEGGKDYWLVKNSWGTSWGLQGYIKMARNKNNMCGIATYATIPTV